MRLIELAIAHGDSLVRQIGFKSGLNLILDKAIGKSTKSGNNVGKTTVLRLIDFCLGSDGDDIWQDSEFKTSINQAVYDYLHGVIPVSITLAFQSDTQRSHTLKRVFKSGRIDKTSLFVDGVGCRNISEYRTLVKQLLFGSASTKPSLRQLAPKFVRSSQALMSKTLRFLGDYTSDVDYEAVHLFLFGFFKVDVLEERPRLMHKKKKLARDLEAITRARKEGEIEQLLLHLRREIEQLGLSDQVRGEVPEIAAHANNVSRIRGLAARAAGELARIDGEIASIELAIEQFKSDYDGIDRSVVESVYREAGKYIPELQHDWDDLSDFVQNLRGRKQRFLEVQLKSLRESQDRANSNLIQLQSAEASEIDTLMQSHEFTQALAMRAELEEKLKRLGSLEQDLDDIRNLKASIELVENQLQDTKDQIESEKAQLRDRVSVFNKHFSELSELLYGEQYLLHFEETTKGSFVFQLSAVGSNVGAGKKVSQTAAFDLAYVDFLKDTQIHFPKFVCHDGVESIHGNQLAALLEMAETSGGQLILATLRDKLPEIPDEFIKKNTILELSQDDKLFRL